MRIYIAGPMTGKPCYNAALFSGAARRWKRRGHDPVTPHELNNAVWQDTYGVPFDPCRDRAEHGDPILAKMVLEDVRAIMSADAIGLLPGWLESAGTRPELFIALNQGKKVFDAMTGERLFIRSQTAYQIEVGASVFPAARECLIPVTTDVTA